MYRLTWDRLKKLVLSFQKRCFTWFYGVGRGVERQIMFISFRGKQYSDNPRAISEALHRLYPEYTIVWALNSTEDKYHLIPDYIKIVKYDSKDFYRQLAISFCVVSNCNYGRNICKRPGQFFVQTWHGDIGVKAVLIDSIDDKTDKYRVNSIRDNIVTDLCIAASDYGIARYHTAFNYHGDILNIGMPRDDALVRDDDQEKTIIRNRLGISSDCSILLFAPTYRDDGADITQIDFERVINSLERKTGEHWIPMFRMHPHNTKGSISLPGEYVDVTDYPDMTDLLLIADFLITDFSSTFGDFIHKDGPIILALFDIEDYMKNSRDLNYDLRDIGLAYACNQNELELTLERYNTEDYLLNNKRVRERFHAISSPNASEEIAKIINKHYIECLTQKATL